MKCYCLFPTFELEANDERSRACIEVVSSIVVTALRQGGDHIHFAVDQFDTSAEPLRFSDVDALKNCVRQSVDPGSGKFSKLRSIATCRAAVFGYDGQAFLCLRHEDEPPITPDPSLVVISEQPEIISETDYFDGWVPSDAEPAIDS